MNTRFNKDYYQEAKLNKEDEYEVEGGKWKVLWHLSIEQDYFTEDRKKVLDEVIKDMEEEVEKLKKIRDNAEKAIESWDSISK